MAMEKDRKKTLASSLLLMITALIWGVAFVAQSEGLNYVGGFTLNGSRFLVGGMVLLPYVLFAGRRKREESQKEREAEKKRLKTGVIGGICCGCFLCLASSLQQFGIAYTTVGKAGFITALYIVIVPLLGLFMHHKVGANIWISVVIAAAGMYLLCITEEFSIGRGDLLVFLCAVGFSFHILVIDHFSPKADGVVISCVQFFTAGCISLVLMFAFEEPSWKGILAAWLPILYAGVMSSGVGYTLQIIGQKNLDPTVASLIMSLESVFAMLAGWVILGQKMSARELLGCALVFGAIILAQIPMEKFKKA